MSTQRYTTTAIVFHWVVALLIFIVFGIGWFMGDIPKTSPDRLQYYAWHKWLGVTVLGLVILRILWRITHSAPPLPPAPRWQTIAMHSLHIILYLLMIIVPLSGLLHGQAAGRQLVYFDLFTIPALIDPNPQLRPIFKATHYYSTYLIIGLVILHILAALKHQWIDRDRLMARMNLFSR